MDKLIVRGAREHNLKDVSIDLPRDALIVFTGLSGSGKSSLAFDTIFAEGQRRYVESLSAYARQFLGQMDKPDVDFIEGLSPAGSIDQKSTSRNPRSTVGTITEVYDYLRLLFARAGRPHCPVCGEPVSRQTPQQIVDRVLELDEGARFQVLAPVVRGRKGEYGELFRDLQTKGYSRARVDGETVSLAEPPKLDKKYKHTIDVVIDRLSVKASAKRRLTDSVETALGLAGGLVTLDFVDLPEKDSLRERRFSEKLACPNEHPLSMDELEPRSFSFNSPYGACPECTGLGTRLEVDPELLIPNDDISLAEGGLHGVGQPPLGGLLDREAVDDHLDGVLLLLLQLRRVGERVHHAVDPHPGEALGLQLAEQVDVFTLAAADHRGQHLDPGALGHLQHPVDDLLRGLPGDRAAALRAVRPAGPRVEQPEVVVDLGDRADGAARVSAGRLLVDGDRRRQALDEVDVGLVHLAEELPRVRAERLHVAALALGEDRVECQAGLPRPGQPGEDDQGIARQVERDVLEIVLARAADDETISHFALCSPVCDCGI